MTQFEQNIELEGELTALEEGLTYSILSTYTREMLEIMSIARGLSDRGFNGRIPSRMEKQHFIDYLIYIRPTNPDDYPDEFDYDINHTSDEEYVDYEESFEQAVDASFNQEQPESQKRYPTPEIPDEETTDETRALECKVCTINNVCIVLAKCGHVFCYTCTVRFQNKCATCRTSFTDKTMIRMYL